MGFFFEPQPKVKEPTKAEKKQALPTERGCGVCTLKGCWPSLLNSRMPMYVSREADILVLGEAPNQQEDLKGRPFAGVAGDLLRQLIPGREIDRLAWQNTVRCRPPDDATPSPADGHACSVHLEEEILKVRPKAILGVGSVPLARFYPGVPIGRIHGQKVPVKVGDHYCWYYPVIHPSFVSRTGGSTRSAGYPILKTDIAKFFKEVDKWPTVSSVVREFSLKNVIRVDTFDEAISYLNKMRDIIAIDVETTTLRPYEANAVLLTCAISDGEVSIGFSVNHPERINAWAKEFIHTVVTTRKWVVHNGNMELSWFWSLLGRQWYPNNYQDTMVLYRMRAQRAANLGLDDLTRIYFGQDVKKLVHLNKKKMGSHSLAEIIPYNGIDAQATALLYHRLEAEMSRHNMPPTTHYRRNVDRALGSIRSTSAMEVDGLYYSPETVAKFDVDLQEKIEVLVKEASSLYEVRQFEINKQKPFNIGSPADVATALVEYGKCSLPKTRKGKGDNYSTDDEVLEGLAETNPLARVVQDYRELTKLHGTYVRPFVEKTVVGIDGLVHPKYSVCLVETGRLSSEDPNIQNFPNRKHKEVRSIIVAPEGYVLAAFDYAQLEARLIAMASKDRAFCDAIVNGMDMHSYWRDVVVKEYPLYLDYIAERFEKTETKEILKAARNDVKANLVFASLYNAQTKTCAERMHIPLNHMTAIHTLFWNTYPGVRKWLTNQQLEYKNTGSWVSLTGLVRHAIMTGNEPINNPIQCTGGHVVLEAQNALYERSVRDNDPLFQPRINIHDDLVFILPDDDRLDWYLEEIATEIIKPRFDWLIVPLATECRIGYNWAELSTVKTWSGDYHK